MTEIRGSAAWIRPSSVFFALVGVLALDACGGGSGAPNNPFATVPARAPLTVPRDLRRCIRKVRPALTISAELRRTGVFEQYGGASRSCSRCPGTPSRYSGHRPSLTLVTITIQDSGRSRGVGGPSPVLPGSRPRRRRR